MNSPDSKKPSGLNVSQEPDATLRLLAQVHAPEGLEDRVKASLRASPRTGKVLPWPTPAGPGLGWLRGAAAAGIVFVVAGGGWSVYSHVRPAEAPQAAAVPRAASPGSGSFSSAGAVRTPQTLQGPVLKHAVKPSQEPAVKKSGKDKKSGGAKGTTPKKQTPGKPIP
jgi:hypothetical protein